MGPSVEFVSRINGSFSQKKNMGQFFSRKKDQTRGEEGGGCEGGLAKDKTFYVFFFGTLHSKSCFVLFTTVVTALLSPCPYRKAE